MGITVTHLIWSSNFNLLLLWSYQTFETAYQYTPSPLCSKFQNQLLCLIMYMNHSSLSFSFVIWKKCIYLVKSVLGMKYAFESSCSRCRLLLMILTPGTDEVWCLTGSIRRMISSSFLGYSSFRCWQWPKSCHKLVDLQQSFAQDWILVQL